MERRGLEAIMRAENMVTTTIRLGDHHTSFDATADAFLKEIGCVRRGGIYHAKLGDRIEVRMPEPVAEALALDLLEMLPHEVRLRVLAHYERHAHR